MVVLDNIVFGVRFLSSGLFDMGGLVFGVLFVSKIVVRFGCV